MTSKQKSRIATIRKRMAHLEQRIASEKHHDSSYDRQELSALKWAVEFIESELDAREDAKGESFFND